MQSSLWTIFTMRIFTSDSSTYSSNIIQVIYVVSIPNVWGTINNLITSICNQELLEHFVTWWEKSIDMSHLYIVFNSQVIKGLSESQVNACVVDFLSCVTIFQFWCWVFKCIHYVSDCSFLSTTKHCLRNVIICNQYNESNQNAIVHGWRQKPASGNSPIPDTTMHAQMKWHTSYNIDLFKGRRTCSGQSQHPGTTNSNKHQHHIQCTSWSHTPS